MPAPGIVLAVAVVLIVAALVYYLVSTIVALRRITVGLDEAIAGVGELIEKSAPVNEVVDTINAHLDAAVGALEGLLVKKAGLRDAVGLIDGLYPGAAAQGLRDFPESAEIVPPRIAEVYTRGVLTLARLGREAPIAAISPEGPVLRHRERAASQTRMLYPNERQLRPVELDRSPVIGSDSPVQYEPALTPGMRLRTRPDSDAANGPDAGRWAAGGQFWAAAPKARQTANIGARPDADAAEKRSEDALDPGREGDI
jgi:hypothetical protein